MTPCLLTRLAFLAAVLMLVAGCSDSGKTSPKPTGTKKPNFIVVAKGMDEIRAFAGCDEFEDDNQYEEVPASYYAEEERLAAKRRMLQAAPDGRTPDQLREVYDQRLADDDAAAAQELLDVIAEIMRRDDGLYDKTLMELAIRALRIHDSPAFAELLLECVPKEACSFHSRGSSADEMLDNIGAVSYVAGRSESVFAKFRKRYRDVLAARIEKGLQERINENSLYRYRNLFPYPWSKENARLQLRIAWYSSQQWDRPIWESLWFSENLRRLGVAAPLDATERTLEITCRDGWEAGWRYLESVLQDAEKKRVTP